MEDLTKQQMILLTLLVSFVSSIATSISVVTLLNETPMTVTQTINRIVEKTIEKVVPAEILPPSPPPKPVISTNENDLIVGAVETNLSKMVVISGKKPGTEEGKEEFTPYGIGFVADASGLVATEKHLLGESAEYFAKFSDGKIHKAQKIFVDEKSPLAFLQLLDEKDQSATGFSSVSFTSSDPKLGAIAVAIGGKNAATVYKGIVSEKAEGSISTNISLTGIDRGGILFGTDGKVFGMNVLVASGEGIYTFPSASILSVIETYKKQGAAQI